MDLPKNFNLDINTYSKINLYMYLTRLIRVILLNSMIYNFMLAHVLIAVFFD